MVVLWRWPPAAGTESRRFDRVVSREARIKQGEFNIRSVVGTVKNTATKTYGYVQVSINLYDSAGKQVGSTMANVNNLEPGVSWDFEAVIIEDNVTTFKVMDVTGF